jgi:hypothetical protein
MFASIFYLPVLQNLTTKTPNYKYTLSLDSRREQRELIKHQDQKMTELHTSLSQVMNVHKKDGGTHLKNWNWR